MVSCIETILAIIIKRVRIVEIIANNLRKTFVNSQRIEGVT